MSVFTNRASASAEQATAYTNAILGLLGDQDAIDVLKHTPPALHQATSNVAPIELRKPEAPGKWSVVQVLQHLADSELVGGFRFRMILAHDRPQLSGYDQDLWADRLHYEESDPEEALQLFACLRSANLRLFERATAAELGRVGVHAERGQESVAHLMRLYAGHDLLHLQQIERIKKAVAR